MLRNGSLVQWGTISTYLSHLLLIEHIVHRWRHDDDAAFLILQECSPHLGPSAGQPTCVRAFRPQDDTQLRDDWLQRLRASLDHTPSWQRVLLVWCAMTAAAAFTSSVRLTCASWLMCRWGLTRPRDCDAHSCRVRPPAGPTSRGERFYHGLQVAHLGNESTLASAELLLAHSSSHALRRRGSYACEIFGASHDGCAGGRSKTSTR